MIILDTDHLVILKYSHGSEYATLTARMAASPDEEFVTTVITLEEQLRGWLGLIRRSQDPHRQVSAYDKLNDVVDYFSRWTRLPFDDIAANQFADLRRQKVRIGTMDLTIGQMGNVNGKCRTIAQSCAMVLTGYSVSGDGSVEKAKPSSAGP